MMLTFRFVPFHSVYYTILYSVLFRPLPFSFGEENDSNVRKANTCAGMERFEGVRSDYTEAVETVWREFVVLDK